MFVQIHAYCSESRKPGVILIKCKEMQRIAFALTLSKKKKTKMMQREKNKGKGNKNRGMMEYMGKKIKSRDKNKNRIQVKILGKNNAEMKNREKQSCAERMKDNYIRKENE